MTEEIERARELVQTSSRIVVLTGAGVSTPSGIPDFRSPGSGLWERDDPAIVASLSTFRRNPMRFYRWIRPLAEKTREAKPNTAHIALAELESRGKLSALVTQNIDGLHERAGSKAVYNVHGSLEWASCARCARRYPGLETIDRSVNTPALCECGGVLKPDIVFFEEALPEKVFRGAARACAEADLIVVAGSSLEVAPVGELPLYGLRNGAGLIIVNLTPTYLDPNANFVLRGDVATILPAIFAPA